MGQVSSIIFMCVTIVNQLHIGTSFPNKFDFMFCMEIFMCAHMCVYIYEWVKLIEYLYSIWMWWNLYEFDKNTSNKLLVSTTLYNASCNLKQSILFKLGLVINLLVICKCTLILPLNSTLLMQHVGRCSCYCIHTPENKVYYLTINMIFSSSLWDHPLMEN